MKKNHLIFSTISLALFFLFSASVYVSCKDGETASPPKIVEPFNKVAYFLNLIEERKKTGNSVVFHTDDDNWVENPTSEWLSRRYGNENNEAKDRSSGDHFTVEATFANGARVNFFYVHFNFPHCSAFGSVPVCYSTGNTYVDEVDCEVQVCTPLSVRAFSGPSTPACRSSGTCQLKIWRRYDISYTGPDPCYCLPSPYTTTFDVPAGRYQPYSLGTWCCELPACSY